MLVLRHYDVTSCSLPLPVVCRSLSEGFSIVLARLEGIKCKLAVAIEVMTGVAKTGVVTTSNFIVSWFTLVASNKLMGCPWMHPKVDSVHE